MLPMLGHDRICLKLRNVYHFGFLTSILEVCSRLLFKIQIEDNLITLEKRQAKTAIALAVILAD
ncbi:hypothetical protein [Trichocoleus sp. FACHB-40]|uniref:hypothetical protein n=1 Tax=Trichocoleus sp. FACHB-40 TaxID=2692870 RepID=UPI00168532B6|nr:hypothetical protein [Trichocoleus sp. FACHB-40]